MSTAVAITASVWDIPRRCDCDWEPPDFRCPPHLRRWALARVNPLCRVHGDLQVTA